MADRGQTVGSTAYLKERQRIMGIRAQLETDAVTEIHRYQIFIVVFGVFSLCSYWENYPEGSIGGGVGGGICLLFIALLLLRKRKNNRKKQRLLELQREDHENMRKLQEQMTKLREQ